MPLRKFRVISSDVLITYRYHGNDDKQCNHYVHVYRSSSNKGYTNIAKIVSEYDQEIPQSQTTDNPMAPPGRATQPSGDTRKTN